MTDFYIDTTVAGPGLGTQVSPWKNLEYAWTRFGAGTHTVYCTGGQDLLTAILSAGNLSATAITIVGNWGGYNLNETTCYKLKSNTFGMISVGSKSVTFKRVLLENGTSDTPSSSARSIVVSGGLLAFEGCGYAFCAAATTNAFYGISAYNAGSGLTLNNCIVWAKSIGTSPVNSNTRLVTANLDCTTKIGNCIFHVGGYTFTFSTGGNTNNGATPNYKNCVTNASSVAATYTNCVYNGSQNVVLTGCDSASVSLQNSFWVSPATGDFTPVTTPPALILDKGVDNSSVMGHSLDMHGNNRSSAPAGAAWDRGPYEYGFGAPYEDVHTVTDISQAGDPDCIYYGQTPTIVVGDKFSHKDVTETNLWPVSIDAQGFPIVDSNGGTGTDSFLFNIGRSGSWSPTPPASDSWTFTIAAAGPPILLTVNNGNPVYAGQTSVPFTGTDLGPSIISRTLLLTQGDIEVVQDQVSGDANGGVFNVVGYGPGGKLKYGQTEFKVTVP